MPRPERRTQAERSDTTRAALLAAGRELFTAHGFANVSLEQLVHTAGLTRGALYHHFRDKTDLFRAVYEQIEQECVDHVATSIHTVTTVENDIRRGVAAFLDICDRPDVRQIALADAPTVLGWQQWRQIEAHYSLGLILGRLELAAADGHTLVAPPPVLASLVLSTAMEAALLVAAADDPATVRSDAERALRAILAGLLEDG